MPALSAWSVRAALCWLAVAALLGALILARAPLGHPEWAAWIPAHGEVMLVGWMMQLAFGVAHWILPRQPVAPAATAGDPRGNVLPVLFVLLALNTGVVLVVAGFVLPGRVLEAAAAIGYAAQAVPRIRASGWGAAGKEGDLVRLKRRPELI